MNTKIANAMLDKAKALNIAVNIAEEEGRKHDAELFRAAAETIYTRARLAISPVRANAIDKALEQVTVIAGVHVPYA